MNLSRWQSILLISLIIFSALFLMSSLANSSMKNPPNKSLFAKQTSLDWMHEGGESIGKRRRTRYN